MKPLLIPALLFCSLLSAGYALVEDVKPEWSRFRVGSGAVFRLNRLVNTRSTTLSTTAGLTPGIQYFPVRNLVIGASVSVIRQSTAVSSVFNIPPLVYIDRFTDVGLDLSIGYYQPIGDRWYLIAKGYGLPVLQFWSRRTRGSGDSDRTWGTDTFTTFGASLQAGYKLGQKLYLETPLGGVYSTWVRLTNDPPNAPLQLELAPILSGISLYYQI